MSAPADDRPLAPWGRRTVEVVSSRQLGAYYEFTVDDPQGAHLRAGQFHMLSAAEHWASIQTGRPFLPRAVSFLRSEGSEISFLIHDVGPGTARLCGLREGDRVELLGPLGNGFTKPNPACHTVLAGGGIGVAPVLALSDSLNAEGIDHDLILGFRSSEFAAPFADHERAVITTDDGSSGLNGNVLDPISEIAQRGSEVEIFACGPPMMLEGIRSFAAENAITAHLALETPMACGYGSCFGCVVETEDGYERACVDGPVFLASRLMPAKGGG